MKRFRFSLEVLLRLRQRSEERARQELGRLTSECLRLDQQLELLAKERLGAMKLEAQDGGLGQALALRQRYLLRIDQAVERITKERARLEIEREKAAEKYREARKSLLVIQNLREQHLRAHREEAAKQEQEQVDDIAGSRYLQNRALEGRQ